MSEGALLLSNIDLSVAIDVSPRPSASSKHLQLPQQRTPYTAKRVEEEAVSRSLLSMVSVPNSPSST